MAVPANVDEMLNLIRKSGMIDETRLDSYLADLQQLNRVPPDARKLAGALVRDGLMTYFQAEQFLLGKWRGFTIGKYKLLERIGVGGMGQVFLCEHLYMKRRVAIKILPPSKAEQPASLGRFYREARASGSLDHPNIVRTHDIDQDGHFHFLVMEYVDGSSILEIVKRTGPLDPLRAAHYVRQAARALAHANRSGIVHRDIKPGNIMVDRDGAVKILDMGLAKFFHDPNDQLTKKYDEHNVLGTADYVAPEQTLNSHDVDIRADIYALGATFYYMLAGHPPFPDGSVSDKLLWHQTRQPTPIRYIRREVPEGLALILEKMMVKDMRNRYQLPEEIDIALAPWTTTPIPAPTIAELPMLSPAAMEGINLTRGPREEGSWSGNMPNPLAPTAESSPVPASPASSSAAIHIPTPSYPSSSSINFGPNPGAVPTTAPPRSLLSPPTISTASTSRNYAPQGPPDPTQRRLNPPSQPATSDPANDTGNMVGNHESTPTPTERTSPTPKVAPLPAFPRPDTSTAPGGIPPTNMRMMLVILLTAFIGSSLGMLAWSVFMGSGGNSNTSERRSEK